MKSSDQYASQDVVRHSQGRAYTLSVVGFVITGRTVGARVALTPRQARLWGQDDHEGATSRTHDTAFTVITDSPRSKKRSNVDVEMLSVKMGHVAVKDRPRFLPICGLGSRAHITLGYSKGCTAVQTGLDQIKVIEIEESYHHGNAVAKRPRRVELDDASLIHYGDGQCVVYLNDPIPVTSLFSGRY